MQKPIRYLVTEGGRDENNVRFYLVLRSDNGKTERVTETKLGKLMRDGLLDNPGDVGRFTK